MGLRFDLCAANWIAYVIDDGAEAPWSEAPESGRAARDDLEAFLLHLRDGLMSTASDQRTLQDRIRLLLTDLQGGPADLRRALESVREFFRDRDWTALILPGGHGDAALDEFLCSPSLLRTIVDSGATARGLLLQLSVPPAEAVAVCDVFPAFAKGLAARTRWPALLAWNREREAALFPIPNRQSEALERLLWVLRRLTRAGLQALRAEYGRTFGVSSERPTTIIQLSDIHLGSEESNVRLPRLQQHVSELVEAQAEDSDVLIAVTGDLMDTPDDEHLDRVRAFLQFLTGLNTPPPIVLLGNHDVRTRGFLGSDLSAAFQIPEGSPSGVRWFDKLGLGVVCVNSVADGRLAAGRVGERQMVDLANEIDRRPRRDELTLVCAVHHHPTPVERPEWYAAPFYERILGSAFERTDALEDAASFMQFVGEQRFAAVLHGHKHVPRLVKHEASGATIVGCGSSVGKIATRDGTPYLSVNLLTIDRAHQRLSARLLASRAAGGRLQEQSAHQIVLASSIARS
jgi:hypothetical protein